MQHQYVLSRHVSPRCMSGCVDDALRHWAFLCLSTFCALPAPPWPDEPRDTVAGSMVVMLVLVSHPGPSGWSGRHLPNVQGTSFSRRKRLVMIPEGR